MEILEVFRRDSPFGAFLDVQLVPPPAMLWQLMVRETNVEGEKELESGYEEKYDKDSLRVFVEENWSKSVVCYTSIVERFSKLCRLLDDEGKKEYALQWIVKVATLMFVVLVLIGHAKKDAPVQKWILGDMGILGVPPYPIFGEGLSFRNEEACQRQENIQHPLLHWLSPPLIRE
ncbi:unnamed protein product [Cuscuta campestris]|uniref:Uncharacterized protein n=1 Tax=Cuscuta campestris TaxID=132261 RepID=A0A484N9R5_9ASTE|nr:unnamed protein product [Cuscuta campestris]